MLPEALLTSEEVKKLVKATENPRDRAFTLTHYESGCRVGETLSLKIANLSFDQHGAVLIVNGKTGPRRVRIMAAAPALVSWLNIHPLRDNPNAALWVGMGTVGRYEALDYYGARALLRRLAKKSRLKQESIHASSEAHKGNGASQHSYGSSDERITWMDAKLRHALRLRPPIRQRCR